MKKILIFSLAYYPHHVSGAEAAVHEVTNRISDISFVMITLRFNSSDSPHEHIGNVEVNRVGFGGRYVSKLLFIPLAALTGIRLHRKHHFDALWAIMTYMLFPVVLMRAYGYRIPHILTLQDGDPYEKVFLRWWVRPLSNMLNYGFRTASIIQAISAYLGTWPQRRGYTGTVEIIHNGANPRDLSDAISKEESASLVEMLGKKPGEVWLVNTARLEYQKAHDDVIRALKRLPAHIKFLVVGGGSEEVALKRLAAELGISERVIFTGHVDRKKVTTYRRVGDIFVAPSRSEGLGNAFLSAMASRLPVVATQEGGLAEFIFDARRNPTLPTTAWVVDKNSPGQIADVVQDILAHPEVVQEVTERARELVAREYNWDTIAVQMRTRIFRPVLRV